MKYVTVGNTKIPALGYGTWKLAGRECETCVTQALETGYRHIDTAQIYANEADVGKAIENSGLKREEIFLTTKVWIDRLGNGPLQKSVKESLKKLKTDYTDLLLIHWPVFDVPLKEQLAALRAVQNAGQAKLIGVSNFTVALMKESIETLGAPIVNNQVEYHPFLSQKPVLDYARAHGMSVTAYTPVARGKVAEDPVLNDIGRKHGKTAAQTALRWLIQQDNVCAIPKAASEKNMKANIDIFDFELDAAEMKAIHALARPDGRRTNPDWAPAWDAAEAA